MSLESRVTLIQVANDLSEIRDGISHHSTTENHDEKRNKPLNVIESTIITITDDDRVENGGKVLPASAEILIIVFRIIFPLINPGRHIFIQKDRLIEPEATDHVE